MSALGKNGRSASGLEAAKDDPKRTLTVFWIGQPPWHTLHGERRANEQMAFLFTEDGRDDDVVGAFQRYRDYLESVSGSFPPSAYTLATSDWYFSPEDHRCPHDAWLESFHLTEPSTGQRHETRTLSLQVRLLGAHHDGYIELLYPQVFSYHLN